jgi:hypothetical protein
MGLLQRLENWFHVSPGFGIKTDWMANGEWTVRMRPSVDERLRRRKAKSVRLRHWLAGDLAVADIEAVT